MPILWTRNIVAQALCLKRPEEDTRTYLHRLWDMNCPFEHFMEAARSEGYLVGGVWDDVPQMPVMPYFH